MNDIDSLPSYSEERLAGLDPLALIDLMVSDEDRVPRNVIDACVRREAHMVTALEALVARPFEEEPSDSRAPGRWWLKLHAVMVLGLIGTQEAGLLLVLFMRRLAEARDYELLDWLAGYWPAFFANKPDSVLPSLHDLCEERSLGWYMRTNAMDPVLAAAERRGREALDEALAWAARMAADEEEEWEMRLSCGNSLLDFPRAPYRDLLENLASRQKGRVVHFSADDVERAYATLEDEPARKRGDPWAFCRPEAIVARQERWAREDAQADAVDVDPDYIVEDSESPFIRPTPKVGRNDSCPCGSGKKYKKCCLIGGRDLSGSRHEPLGMQDSPGTMRGKDNTGTPWPARSRSLTW